VPDLIAVRSQRVVIGDDDGRVVDELVERGEREAVGEVASGAAALFRCGFGAWHQATIA
jgi:hypothetical protein